MSEYPRSIIIENVTAKWCKISGADAPVNSFKSKQWEMQIQTKDPAKADEMREYGLNVKEAKEDSPDAGTFSVQLKRKGLKADGTPNQPVKIVDAQLQPMSGENIGNGSTVNVNLWQYAYEAPGRKGIATSLTAVQVTKLEEYTPSVGFTAVSVEKPTENGEMPF